MVAYSEFLNKPGDSLKSHRRIADPVAVPTAAPGASCLEQRHCLRTGNVDGFRVELTSLFALQAFLHMAVGLGMVPPTGLALPLVSFGRSNLLVTLLSLGVLLSVARAAEEGWDPSRRTSPAGRVSRGS